MGVVLEGIFLGEEEVVLAGEAVDVDECGDDDFIGDAVLDAFEGSEEVGFL